MRSKETAEELVNDVFLGLWQKRNTLDTIANLNVYLYVAVKNASLNYLRKNKMPQPVSVDDLIVHHLRLNTHYEKSILLILPPAGRLAALRALGCF